MACPRAARDGRLVAGVLVPLVLVALSLAGGIFVLARLHAVGLPLLVRAGGNSDALGWVIVAPGLGLVVSVVLVLTFLRHSKPPGNRRSRGGGGMACPPVDGHTTMLPQASCHHALVLRPAQIMHPATRWEERRSTTAENPGMDELKDGSTRCPQPCAAMPSRPPRLKKRRGDRARR